MDPISAAIGGAASIAGAFMNTSSQQAINAAQMQQAQYINQGLNLPVYYKQMVRGAEGAGLNPLAVLGMRGPDAVANLQSPSPGAGLQDAGAMISRVEPHATELADAQRRKLEVDIANGRTLGTNAALQGERIRILNAQLEGYIARHPYAIPEGLQFPTTSDMLEEMRNVGSKAGAFGDRFGNWSKSPIAIPQWLGGGM